jgi:putative oxidoreductase
MAAGLSLGLLILRLGVGLTIAGHGGQKLFGWWGGPGIKGFTGMTEKLQLRPARPLAVAAALAEFGGGILIAVGLLSPVGPLILGANMVVAIATVHLAKGFWNQVGGIEFPLLVCVSCVALSITGPGRYSLDAAAGLSLPEPLSWIMLAVIAFGGAAFTLAGRRTRRRLELG